MNLVSDNRPQNERFVGWQNNNHNNIELWVKQKKSVEYFNAEYNSVSIVAYDSLAGFCFSVPFISFYYREP